MGHLGDVLHTASTALRLRRMFDLPREFATEWYAFLHPAPGGHKTLTIQLSRQHFAGLGKDKSIQVEAVSLALQTRSGGEMKAQLSPPLGDQPPDLLTLAAAQSAQAFSTVTKQGIGVALDQAVPWNLRLRPSALGFDDLADNEIEECFLVVEYTLQP